MNPECLFSRGICINLARRHDRWMRMKARLENLGIPNIIRFPAMDGRKLTPPEGWHSSPAAYGCLCSHLAVVEQARAEKWPNVLILEDDVEFASDFHIRLIECLNQLPSRWDMLYLGANHLGEPIRIAPNLIRLTKSNSTFAYALNHTVYDAFLEANRTSLAPVDVNNRSLHQKFDCYCFHPHLAWVETDYSDVNGNTRNFWWIRESLIMEGSELAAVLKNTAMIVPLKPQSVHAPAPRCVPAILHHYQRVLPTLRILLVEMAAQPTLLEQALPHNCHHRFFQTDKPWTRARACNAGFDEFRDKADFFIFQDEDIFLHRNELSANLLMALKFDFVSSFANLYEISPADSELILRTGKWDTRDYQPLPRRNTYSDSCIFTRRGFEQTGRWPETPDDAEFSHRLAAGLRCFESPGQAFRIASREKPFQTIALPALQHV